MSIIMTFGDVKVKVTKCPVCGGKSLCCNDMRQKPGGGISGSVSCIACGHTETIDVKAGETYDDTKMIGRGKS